ncbi:MAG: hypothetical protein EHM18_07025, partial [Acidobacteria bacterium]
MSRSAILERLRRLHEAEQAPALPSTLPEFPRYADLVEQFKVELERVSGVFLDGRSPELLRQALERVLADAKAGEIYWESEEIFAKHGIPCQLRDSEASKRGRLVRSDHPLRQVHFPLSLHSHPYNRATLASLPISVSSATCGIAETGTVLETTGPAVGRLLPVLAPVHVAFLRRQDLLMNHADFFSSVKLGDAESYLVLVTGPSRTADIEKTLVLGVHGPQKHYVI